MMANGKWRSKKTRKRWRRSFLVAKENWSQIFLKLLEEANIKIAEVPHKTYRKDKYICYSYYFHIIKNQYLNRCSETSLSLSSIFEAYEFGLWLVSASELYPLRFKSFKLRVSFEWVPTLFLLTRSIPASSFQRPCFTTDYTLYSTIRRRLSLIINPPHPTVRTELRGTISFLALFIHLYGDALCPWALWIWSQVLDIVVHKFQVSDCFIEADPNRRGPGQSILPDEIDVRLGDGRLFMTKGWDGWRCRCRPWYLFVGNCFSEENLAEQYFFIYYSNNILLYKIQLQEHQKIFPELTILTNEMIVD